MRSFLLSILAAGIGVFFFYSRDLTWVGSEVRGVLEGLWYQKVISVSGLKSIQEYEVMEVLPADRSVGWWNRNLDAVGTELRKDPRVKAVAVSRCNEGAVSLYCFEVKVEEREPKFLANLAGKLWIVGDDGGFISPVDGKDVPPSLPEVFGLRGDVQLVQALASRISVALEDIDTIVGHKISSLAVDRNGELRAQFEDLPFAAVFSFSGHDELTVADQARRLVALLQAKQAQLATIKEVDLAFDKLAVVKYVEPIKETQPKKTVTKKRAH
jgi:cell division septal protein FtsQ